MESLGALLVGVFLLGLFVEISKIILRAVLYCFKIGIVLVILAALISSFISLTGGGDIGIPGVCNRIDGCPIVDGICIGCE